MSVKRARDMAKQISCLNNLKNLGSACTFYAMDYNSWLPASVWQPGDWTTRWFEWDWSLPQLGYVKAKSGYIGSVKQGGGTVRLCLSGGAVVGCGQPFHLLRSDNCHEPLHWLSSTSERSQLPAPQSAILPCGWI